ncbi:MAG TPA: transglycosylase family protein [Microlunatus sp.]|nr:transglycosylase family protein [Microlunatus sp.]
MTTSIVKRIVGVLAAIALALGISAAAAGPAEAASSNVWDKVARCESGGRWHISTGNGFYGGLQFSGGTWKAYGGQKYASKAHRATKAEQIAIARRVLARQGPRAWPHCGKKAHLTKKNGKANKKATPSSNPGVKTTKKKSSSRSQAAATPASGRTSSSSPSASSTTVAAKKPATKSGSSAKRVKVRPGDTLAKLAKRHHVRGGWKALWKLNKKTVRNPNALKVGATLIIKK